MYLIKVVISILSGAVLLSWGLYGLSIEINRIIGGNPTPTSWLAIFMVVGGSGTIYFGVKLYRKHSTAKNEGLLGNIKRKRSEDSAASLKEHLVKSSDEEASTRNAARIFVSYRRKDSDDVTGRIYDRLVSAFDKNSIFKDVDSIPLGVDFRGYIDEMVGRCDILITIIGSKWLEVKDISGEQKLFAEADFVRLEIESAIKRNIPIIPVLVRGAIMPAEKNLPQSIKDLAYRNGIPVRADPDFHHDMDRLIESLRIHLQAK